MYQLSDKWYYEYREDKCYWIFTKWYYKKKLDALLGENSHFGEKFQYCYTIAQHQLRKGGGSETILDFSREEADTLLIWFCAYCRIRFESDIHINLMCSDTDVLLLALNFSELLPFNTIFKALSYDIRVGFAYVALGKRITCCDKTGKFAGRQKVTWFKKFIQIDDESLYEQMKLYGHDTTLSNECITAMSSFVAYVYTGKWVHHRNVIIRSIRVYRQMSASPQCHHS